MTLAEAIKHAEEEAGRTMGLCSMEHKQLAEWLKELTNLRAMVAGQTAFHSDEAVNAELGRLLEENRVLRDALEIAMPAVEEVYTDCAPQYIKVKAALTGREG
jgi:uncharacterized protein YacL (UPF0231 family)